MKLLELSMITALCGTRAIGLPALAYMLPLVCVLSLVHLAGSCGIEHDHSHSQRAALPQQGAGRVRENKTITLVRNCEQAEIFTLTCKLTHYSASIFWIKKKT